jgi:hypothetical protein
MKLLIDAGCYGSIIRPSIVEEYYTSTIFPDTCIIKTATGQGKVKYKANIPAFVMNTAALRIFTRVISRPYCA